MATDVHCGEQEYSIRFSRLSGILYN